MLPNRHVRAPLLTFVTLFAACGCQGGSAAGPVDATQAKAFDAAPVIHDAPAPASPDAPEPDAPPPAPRVILTPSPGVDHAVNVAIARTEAERARGLMYVQNLPLDDGMIFIFTYDSILKFWMKNTLIYLDMIFIDKDMNVVGVVANAVPMTLTERSVGVPSRYVLEVNGGWAASHSVAAGTKVRFEGFAP